MGRTRTVRPRAFHYGLLLVLTVAAPLNAEPPKLILKAEGSRSLNSVAFSADGKVFAQVEENDIHLWDFPSGKLLRSWKPTQGTGSRLGCLALSPDGKRLAVASTHLYHGNILVFDTADGKLVWQQKDATNSEWLELAFSPDGKRLVSTGNFIDRKDEESLLKVWNAADGKFLRELKGGTKLRDLPIPFAPDGKSVLAVAGDDRLIVWDIESGRTSADVRVAPEGETIAEYAFAPDGKTLAVRSNKSLFLWDRANAKRLLVFSDKEGEGTGLQFNADGSSLLGFRREGLAAWDVKTGAARTLLKMEYSGPRTFSPDRKRLVSGHDAHPIPE